VAGQEDDGGQHLARAQRVKEFHPADFRQPHIQQDALEVFQRGRKERGRLAKCDDIHPHGAEQHGQRVPDRSVVVDQGDAMRHFALRPLLARITAGAV